MDELYPVRPSWYLDQSTTPSFFSPLRARQDSTYLPEFLTWGSSFNFRSFTGINPFPAVACASGNPRKMLTALKRGPIFSIHFSAFSPIFELHYHSFFLKFLTCIFNLVAVFPFPVFQFSVWLWSILWWYFVKQEMSSNPFSSPCKLQLEAPKRKNLPPSWKKKKSLSFTIFNCGSFLMGFGLCWRREINWRAGESGNQISVMAVDE